MGYAVVRDATGAPRQAVFYKLCGIAGAQVIAPICELKREGFSPSSGRI